MESDSSRRASKGPSSIQYRRVLLIMPTPSSDQRTRKLVTRVRVTKALEVDSNEKFTAHDRKVILSSRNGNQEYHRMTSTCDPSRSAVYIGLFKDTGSSWCLKSCSFLYRRACSFLSPSEHGLREESSPGPLRLRHLHTTDSPAETGLVEVSRDQSDLTRGFLGFSSI